LLLALFLISISISASTFTYLLPSSTSTGTPRLVAPDRREYRPRSLFQVAVHSFNPRNHSSSRPTTSPISHSRYDREICARDLFLRYHLQQQTIPDTGPDLPQFLRYPLYKPFLQLAILAVSVLLMVVIVPWKRPAFRIARGAGTPLIAASSHLPAGQNHSITIFSGPIALLDHDFDLSACVDPDLVAF
jgi:hypothetical protein